MRTVITTIETLHSDDRRVWWWRSRLKGTRTTASIFSQLSSYITRQQRPYATGELEDSGQENDEKMSRKTVHPRSCARVFRHSVVLSLPAVLLLKLSIILYTNKASVTSREIPPMQKPALPNHYLWLVSQSATSLVLGRDVERKIVGVLSEKQRSTQRK